MKYVCQVCGYVYDEEAEGVKFEELPDDYECPLCLVGKDQFEADSRKCPRCGVRACATRKIHAPRSA